MNSNHRDERESASAELTAALVAYGAAIKALSAARQTYLNASARFGRVQTAPRNGQEKADG